MGSRGTGFSSCGTRLSCSVACGIFADQGSNLCPLDWQADSSPLCHHGSPYSLLFNRGAQCFHVLKCKLIEGRDLSYRTFQRLEYSASQTEEIFFNILVF